VCHTLEEPGHFVEARPRQQLENRLPDHLLGTIVKEPLRAAIPTDNNAVESFADDRLGPRGDDGGERREALALGDVDDRGDKDQADARVGRVEALSAKRRCSARKRSGKRQSTSCPRSSSRG
jgi:hypothetical protein